MMEIVIGIAGLALAVLIYFARVSRGSYTAKQDRIRAIADRYQNELLINSHLAESRYPKLLLNAGILSLEKESDIVKVLKTIDKRHAKSPFYDLSQITHKNARIFLINLQKGENEGR